MGLNLFLHHHYLASTHNNPSSLNSTQRPSILTVLVSDKNIHAQLPYATKPTPISTGDIQVLWEDALQLLLGVLQTKLQKEDLVHTFSTLPVKGRILRKTELCKTDSPFRSVH